MAFLSMEGLMASTPWTVVSNQAGRSHSNTERAKPVLLLPSSATFSNANFLVCTGIDSNSHTSIHVLHSQESTNTSIFFPPRIVQRKRKHIDILLKIVISYGIILLKPRS